MRRQVERFSPGVMAGQCCTSSKLRPQPLHSSSPWLVEQMAMQGVSGVLWYHASQASQALCGEADLIDLVFVVIHHQRVDLGQRAQLGCEGDAVGRGLLLAPVVDGGLDVGDVNGSHEDEKSGRAS